MSQHSPRRPVPQSELIVRLKSHAAREGEQSATPPAAPRLRRGGWTIPKQQLFLKTLARTGSIEESAARVGMSASAAFRLRHHPGATAFRAAWARALMVTMVAAREQAFDRAINGTITPIMRNGEVKGTRRVFSDKLIMFLLGRYDYRLVDMPTATVDEHFLAQMEALVDMPHVDPEEIEFDEPENSDFVHALETR